LADNDAPDRIARLSQAGDPSLALLDRKDVARLLADRTNTVRVSSGGRWRR
jgi:hypothetical protein